tara:strand:+ start:220 stop:453 length:234 start_codon:yes stop_codon:yes gene_type:complete
MGHKKKILFGKKNYIILIISICVISLSYILMSGGESQDPLTFNKEIYSFQRIRLAPSLVILGFAFALLSIIYSNRIR